MKRTERRTRRKAGSRPGLFYLPGRLYDLIFGATLRSVRSRVAAEVEAGGDGCWLDVCCGTGSQFRAIDKPDPPDRSAWGLDKSLGMLRYAAACAPRLSFVCGDAARLPFKDRIFLAVSVSFGLHDKSPEVRNAMMAEARRVLAPGGSLIAVDFENPWSSKSRRGAFLVHLIERAAGGDHYRNGRDFLRRGGLRAFLRENGFVETARHDIELASIGVVTASPANKGVNPLKEALWPK